MYIDHSKFVSYTLTFNGCNFTTHNYESALKQYASVPHGTIYGNKPDGTQTMIKGK